MHNPLGSRQARHLQFRDTVWLLGTCQWPPFRMTGSLSLHAKPIALCEAPAWPPAPLKRAQAPALIQAFQEGAGAKSQQPCLVVASDAQAEHGTWPGGGVLVHASATPQTRPVNSTTVGSEPRCRVAFTPLAQSRVVIRWRAQALSKALAATRRCQLRIQVQVPHSEGRDQARRKKSPRRASPRAPSLRERALRAIPRWPSIRRSRHRQQLAAFPLIPNAFREGAKGGGW